MKKNRSVIGDNKGITLIELLISVVILGIMVAPLFNAFITSSRINADSRKKQRSTEVGKNLLELAGETSLLDLAIACNNIDRTKLKNWKFVTATTELSELIFHPANSTYSRAVYDAANPSASSASLTNKEGSYDLDPYKNVGTGPALKDSLYYYFKGIEANGGKVSALLKYNIGASASKTELQNMELNEISGIRYSDMMIQNTDRVEDVMKKINENTAITAKHGTVSLNQVRRNIIITIEKDNAGPYSVTATYQYGIKGEVYDTVTEKFADTVENLDDIYFLYFPWYGGLSDTITLENDGLVSGKIKIIKQVDATFTKHQLSTMESHYRVRILCNRPGEGSFGPEIITNLGRNLANETMALPLQAIYFFNGFWTNQTSTNSKVKISIELVGKEQEKTIFKDVEVFIFDQEVDVDKLHEVKPIIKLKGGNLL